MRQNNSQIQKNHQQSTLPLQILSVIAIILLLSCIFLYGYLHYPEWATKLQSSTVDRTQPNTLVTTTVAATTPAATTVVENPDDLLGSYLRKADAYAYHTSYIRKVTEGEESLPEGKKLVFITIDDGITTDHTPKMLDTLHELEVPATFYILGQSIGEETKPVLERMLAEGHGIGLHSYNHDYDELYPHGIADTADIMQQLYDAEVAFKKQLGENFFSGTWRYPGGHMSWDGLQPADDAMFTYGVAWIDWNTMFGDAAPSDVRPTTAEGIVNYFKNTYENVDVKNCLVILLHDNEYLDQSREALPEVVNFLRAEGYEFGILK